MSDPPASPDATDTHLSVAVRFRTALLVGAVLRYLVPIAAIPAAAALIPDDVGLLTLLRPGKEVLLLAGGLTRTDGSPGWLVTFLAYLPLMVGGVWVFYGVGRAFRDDLADGGGPDWLYRLIPPERLALAQQVLTRRGPTVAVLGRIAALPPTIVAAAAGTTQVATGRFLAADLVGAIISFAMMFGLGMGLGETYERAGPWLTGLGVVVLLVVFSLFSRWMEREAARQGA